MRNRLAAITSSGLEPSQELLSPRGQLPFGEVSRVPLKEPVRLLTLAGADGEGCDINQLRLCPDLIPG
jgi:hypothetical protein